jgi:homoserine O-acetyltransferase
VTTEFSPSLGRLRVDNRAIQTLEPHRGAELNMAETASPRFLRPLAAPGEVVGQAISFDLSHPLALDSGKSLSPFTVAYKTYGMLNDARSNVVLVCHALTGDQFAAGRHL